VSVEPKQNAFWTTYQPGLRFATSPAGSPAFFREVEEHRYRLEPHIPDIARFADWRERDVLEVGCGIATDGARFARAGAHYVGVDPSPTALELARRRFELEPLEGRFAPASATELPFEDASFDLVYSHGVIHHIPETERAVDEFHRVLKPGGEALVMLYHRDSLNYRVNIMVVRRLLALALLLPGATSAISRLVGEGEAVLEGHRELLRRHRLRYLTDRQLFLSNNTDGPGNPLSKVYSRSEARRLFASFTEVQIAVRYLNLRLFPGGERVAATGLGRSLAHRVGWHLYVRAKRALTPA
jgi:SAM-dependent methyltransferase